MQPEITIRPGRYRHFKGKEYEVLLVARHSETLEPMVVYRALYGEGGVWVRPASMWNEMVVRDGVEARRFTPLGTEQAACCTPSRENADQDPGAAGKGEETA